MTNTSARPSGLAAAFLLALVFLTAIANRGLVTGSDTPFYRDIGTTQLPARALLAELGPSSLDPHVSFGQPYFGNPNLVLAYPFPRSLRSMGLHLLLHLLIGLLGAFALFRSLVKCDEAALFGALAFSLSGYVVSSTAFLNATTTIAWMPWLLLAVEKTRVAEGRRLVVAGLAIAAFGALLVLGGEPALGGIAIALALARAATFERGVRGKALGTLAAGGTAAFLVSAPWILEVVRATAFSSRRLRGFSWNEFSAAGFPPARLLETPFPLLFGDPGKLLSGAFWGFAVNQQNPPYLASLTLGVLPLALAIVFAVSARRNEGRFWLSVAGLALLLSWVPWLPGARAVYEAVPALHVVRYPVKAVLALTLAVAALSALAFDRLLVLGALPRFRARASWVMLVPAAVLAALAVLGRLRPDVIERWLATGWDPTWASDPSVVLGPIVRRLPIEAALAAAILLAGSLLLRGGAEDPRRRFVLLVAVSVDLLSAAHGLLPRAPRDLYETVSPLVASARTLGGRVYEKTGKDTDAVRRGLFGRIAADDARSLALAQTRQGWASTGAVHGLSYAYDPDPDGSYTYLNRVATDVLNAHDWAGRLKWLRAGGVRAVIAHDVPPDLPGLAPVVVERAIGVPTTLYRLVDPLPGTRRTSRAFGASSINEAVAVFERRDFDPATDVVVAGKPPEGVSTTSVDPTAEARVVSERPDVLTIETSGAAPALLHVDRSYTPRVKARVNGRDMKVFVADVHLIAIPVPAGRASVEVDLAP